MPSSDFDWLTDEELGWNQPAQTPEAAPSGPHNYWLWLPAALIVVALVALFVYVVLNRRVADTSARLQAEVLSSHTLAIEAMAKQDFDLFETLLNSRDVGWYEKQMELLSLQLSLARAPLGIKNLPPGAPEYENARIEINLDPDFNTATVTDIRPYIVAGMGSITETIPFERTFFYERIDGNWKLSPPIDEQIFWGKYLREEGEYLTLTFPERDAEVGRLLAPKLNLLVQKICSTTAIDCPPDFRIEMRLDRFDHSLLPLSEGHYAIDLDIFYGRNHVVLPAPTLVGRPLDEAGFQALYRGYGGWLAAVLFSNFVVGEELINEAYLAEQLSRWELQPPPRPSLRMPRPVQAAAPMEALLPEQDILMLCSDRHQLRLLRYQTLSGEWAEEMTEEALRSFGELAVNPMAHLSRLPDYRGILINLQEIVAEEPHWRTYLYQDGEYQLWLDELNPYFFYPPLLQIGINQTNRFLTVYRSYPVDDPQRFEPWWFDLKACLIGECGLTKAGGFPVWSPSGRRTLLVDMVESGEPMLYLGDGQAGRLELIGSGLPITWLDDETYAFVRPGTPGEWVRPKSDEVSELVIDTVSSEGAVTETERVVIDGVRLGKGLPELAQDSWLEILSAAPLPARGLDTIWIIAVSATRTGEHLADYLFLYNPANDELQLLSNFDEERLMYPIIPSPQGGYLAISTHDETQFSLRVLDLSDGQIMTVGDSYPYDWSADDAWLLFVDSGLLRAVAVDSFQEWRIPHNLSGCYSAVWVER